MSSTDVQPPNAPLGPKVPLGVGSLISESFSLFFKNIVKILLIAGIPYLLMTVISGLFMGWGALMGEQPLPGDEGAFFAGMAASSLLNMAVYAFVTAMLIQLAYDVKAGQPVNLTSYISPAIAAIVPLIVLSIVVTLVASIGMIGLIVLGVWIYAVWFVFVPAIVIDRAGFGALGRSAFLTKEYRWPIIGGFIVMLIIVMLLTLIPTFVFGGAALAGGLTTGTIIIFVIVNSLISGLAAGLLSIFVAGVYARLREIKEGISVDKIASVFD